MNYEEQINECCRLRIKERKTHKEIATILGWTRNRVQAILTKHGIK